MADSAKFSFLLFLLVISFSADITVSVDSPQISPSPSSLLSHSGAESPSTGAPAPRVDAPQHAPASSPLPSSPPSPPPENPSPGSSPAPGSSQSPAPKDSSEVNHTGINDTTSKEDDSSGGMSGGKKAGIAIGVIVAAGVVGLAALVYKKRQQNIRRSQYGYAARRELL
ncbi:hypothetical protein L6164_019104 [Bauhinia variegata]|uniref:Uncharacterized protein n=1 Tax=Bauhinia variegata TaxID=167791 RepID=A0ACB9NEJ7_BAUVA|nr:hypothetical protein L6164_019104 [Bauhinia variegata]